MSQSIEINDDEKDILWAETTELSPSEVAQIRTRTDLAALRQKLEAKSPNGELLKALKVEIAGTTQNQSDTKTQAELVTARAEIDRLNKEKDTKAKWATWSWGEDIKSKAIDYIQKPIQTEGTWAFDQSEYVYGVLLRHGVMPDKMIGFFNINPADPVWKQGLMKWLDYTLNKMPIIKHLDFPADIGRATYVYPTKLRNVLVNKIGTLKKDEFDAMLMSLTSERDYHQKLLSALTEIHTGLQSDKTKKEIVTWISSVTAQRDKLNDMMALIKTGNPDVTGLANHMTDYIGLKRWYDATEYGKIMAIHNEADPFAKKILIDSLKLEIATREKIARSSHAQEIRSERTISQNITKLWKDFASDKKTLTDALGVLEKKLRKLSAEKSDIQRQVTSAENTKNALLSKETIDPASITTQDTKITNLETDITTKQGLIETKEWEIEAKKKEIADRQEKYTKENTILQADMDRAKSTREAGKWKLESVQKTTGEQHAVVTNIETGHYATSSHAEGGASRYAQATGNLDPHMASLGTTLAAKNTPSTMAQKKSAIQAEMNTPDMLKLAELEKKWVLAEFQAAAASVESLSKWAEEAIAKLKTGNTPENIKTGEDYLKWLGEAVKWSNDQIGIINDKQLATFSTLPKIDQDALLKASVWSKSFAYISRLASHDAAMKWHAETAMKVNHSKPMRFMYGLIGIVAAGSISTEFAFGSSEVAKNDLKDMAYGFVPGYDLYRAWDGTDLNGRPIKWLDRFERAAWGTLTLAGAIATLWASSLVIWSMRAWVKWVKAANTLSNIVKVGSAGMWVASVSHFGYNLVWLNWKQVGPNGEKVVKIK